MLRDEDVVLVMNKITYDDLLEVTYETANEQSDPIQFLKDFSKLEIDKDERLPYGVIEVHEKNSYWKNKGDF